MKRGDISASPCLATAFTFTGREFDSESGLYYYRARYYDPNSGRFLQRDPEPGKLGMPGTVVNSFAYVLNNPANLTDPSGRFPFLIAIAYLVGYSTVVSVAQAGIQMALNGESWGEGGENFWGKFGVNFAINFGLSALGITLTELANGFKNIGRLISGKPTIPTNYSLGWGGVYSTVETGSGYGFSLGFFQSIPGQKLGSAFYWHEVGHSINFFLSGALGNNRNGLGVGLGTLSYGVFTLPGTGPLQSTYNPFTWTGEGTASLWSWLFSGKFYGAPI